MLIARKREFYTGLALLASFLFVLALIFAPIYGGGRNGLAYADDMFNGLTKGEAYFIPKLQEKVKDSEGKQIDVVIGVKEVELTRKLYEGAGAEVKVEDGKLHVRGDLGKILLATLEDSEFMYRNDKKAIEQKYEVEDGKELFKQWHPSLKKITKELEGEKRFEEARMVKDVTTKGVEPAYNFYGIEPKDIKDYRWLIGGLLVFYVVYTVWYGYGVFYTMEGMGLTAKKPKVKKEV